MTPLVLVPLLVVLLVLVVAALARLVRADGYGRTPPPGGWPVDPGLPSHPYAVR